MPLLQNVLYVPEQDYYYVSQHVHDYVHVELDDGKHMFIDGGTDYRRSGGDLELLGTRFIDYSLHTFSSEQDVNDKLVWGTRGKRGDEPLTYRPIRTFTKDHLLALKSLNYLPSRYRVVVEYWYAKYQ